MRLRELKDKIEKIGVDLNITSSSTGSNNTIQVNNLNEINTKLMQLDELGVFSSSIKKLEETVPDLFNYRGGTLNTSKTEFNNYQKIIREINIEISAVLTAIKMAIPEQDKYSISIKLPPYNNLKKVGRFIQDIEVIFSQVLPSNLRTDIKLNNFDSGSNWIEVIVNNEQAMLFLGSFVEVTLLFVKCKYINLVSTKSELEKSNKITGDDQSQASKVIDALIKESASIQVEEFLKDKDISDDRISDVLEYKQTLNLQMIELAKYLVQGAEIHPALNAPEEVKKEFPNADETRSLANEIKTLLIGTFFEDDLEKNESSEEN